MKTKLNYLVELAPVRPGQIGLVRKNYGISISDWRELFSGFPVKVLLRLYDGKYMPFWQACDELSFGLLLYSNVAPRDYIRRGLKEE